MSERWDDAVKRRNQTDVARIRHEIDQYLARGHAPCQAEYRAAQAAFEVFEASKGSEADWSELETALTALQECTEA